MTGNRVGDVVIVQDGPVVRATIDRPEARNAISPSVIEGLEAAVRQGRDGGAKVLVLRGTAGTFCAGADLAWVLSNIDQPGALEDCGAFAAGIQDPIPDPIPPAGVDIALETVASGLVAPVAAARAPGDGHHLFVADQNGMLWGVTVRGHGHGHGHGDGHGGRHGHGAGAGKWLVADLSGLLVGNLAQLIPGLPYDERGLLGVAFDPRFPSSHSMVAFSFTSARWVTRLYMLCDQFWMVV